MEETFFSDGIETKDATTVCADSTEAPNAVADPAVSAPNREVLAFVTSMNEIAFITDADRNIIAMSNLARRVFDIPEDLSEGVGIGEYLPKVYVDAIYRRADAEDMESALLTFPVWAANGQKVVLEARFNCFRQNGKKMLTVICRDINDVTQKITDLTEREDRYSTIFHKSPVGFIHVNSDGFITDCNNSFFEIFGLDFSDVKGVCIAEENELDIYPEFKNAMMDALAGFSSRHESQYSVGDGEKKGWVSALFSPVISGNRVFLGAIGIVEDITEAKNATEKISYVSSHDTLTGLRNRHKCEEAIRDFEQREDMPLGVIYADLNCLKLANDAFGHQEGDILLKSAAKILKDNAGKNGTPYRIGGDEFILLIEEAGSDYLNERIDEITKACLNWSGEGLISPSMALGGAARSSAGQNLRAVIREAEDTMYANKMKNGKPARMRIIGSLENKLHQMREGALGDRSQRMISWAEWFIENVDYECSHDILRLLCRYHDVGLLAHPEEIPLIGDARSVNIAMPMRHAAVGYRIAKCTAEIANIAEYILSHHEWWDGMGYPNQQRGNKIPRESRIISIFDSLESMICLSRDRGFAVDDALTALESCAGNKFDPDLIERTVPLIRKEPPNFLRNKKVF